MARAILMVLIVLVIIAYGMMFLSWNQDWVAITVWQWPPQGSEGIAQDLPMGYAVLGAVLLGAVLMALFVAGSWAGQRTAHREARAKLAVAKKKLQQLVDKVKEQRRRLQEFEARSGAATAPTEPEISLSPALLEEDEEEL